MSGARFGSCVDPQEWILPRRCNFGVQNRVIEMLIILCLLALTSSCCGQSWRKVEGSLKHVSIGRAGVWGVNADDLIYYREGTYQAPNATGTKWTLVPGHLKQLDVGRDIVVGVNSKNEILYRKDISDENPTGSDWVQLDGCLKHVTVSPYGAIWGVNHYNFIYFRDGISPQNPAGTSWQMVDGKLTQISAGPSGVWGVNANDDIFYREGTYGGHVTMGSGWTNVPGTLAYITSGSEVVVGVNREKRILRRTEISEGSPTENQWLQLDGKLSMIEEYNGTMCGVNGVNDIWVSPTN
ncbi:lectin L6-like isoform X1 [Pomacea canaliculata]|uniref:lectin L6-like isoform X1 n=2 Tax=Pomacea canaliculata TaxID=400727 RepID=UPI000D733FB6|nr:lectin L6-like isoform X1 [Pomacea canaliculata]